MIFPPRFAIFTAKLTTMLYEDHLIWKCEKARILGWKWMQIYIAIFIPPDLAIYDRLDPPHFYFRNEFCLECNLEWFVRESAFEIDFLKQLWAQLHSESLFKLSQIALNDTREHFMHFYGVHLTLVLNNRARVPVSHCEAITGNFTRQSYNVMLTEVELSIREVQSNE